MGGTKCIFRVQKGTDSGKRKLHFKEVQSMHSKRLWGLRGNKETLLLAGGKRFASEKCMGQQHPGYKH